MLLLEAGGEAQRSEVVATPDRWNQLHDSAVDWSLRSEPSPKAVRLLTLALSPVSQSAHACP